MPAEVRNMPTSPTWIGGAPQRRSPAAFDLGNSNRPSAGNGPGVAVGVFNSAKPLPWQTNDNPFLEPLMLPGSKEWSPNAIKERNKTTIGIFMPDTGGSGGGGTGGGARGGGVSASYAPRPQRGITPAFKSNGSAQGNFEAAKNNGRVTPEQEAQAAAYAKSQGLAFDPNKGYSIKPQSAPTSKPSTTPTPANQSTDAPAFGKPAQAQAPKDNWTPGNVKDDNGYVVTGNDKLHGVESYDKNGVPQYGFAAGADGVPVKDLKGKPFWVGEAGPELARIKDGELTVIPNHVIKAAGVTPPQKRSATAFADQAKERGFADGTGPMLITAPSPDRVIATPATPRAGFMTNEDQPPTTADSSFTPSFVPVHTPMVPPPGMGRTAFHRFLASPEGAQWSLNAQTSDARTNAMLANHQQSANTQRQWQMEDRNTQKSDVDQAIADEVAGQRAAHAAMGGTFDAITEAALGKLKPKAQAEFFRHAITAQAAKKQSDEIIRRQEEADKRKGITGTEFATDPSGLFGVPMTVHQDGSRTPIGGALPLTKPIEEMSHEELLNFVKSGGTATKKVGSATLHYNQPQTPKEPLPQLMREKDGSVKAYDRRTGQPLGTSGTPAGYLGKVGLPKKG